MLVEYCLLHMINRHAVVPMDKQKQNKSIDADATANVPSIMTLCDLKLDPLFQINEHLPVHPQWEADFSVIYSILLNAKAYKSYLLDQQQNLPHKQQFADKYIYKMPTTLQDMYAKSSLIFHLNTVPADPCKFVRNSQGTVIGTLLTAYRIKFYPYLGIPVFVI